MDEALQHPEQNISQIHDVYLNDGQAHLIDSGVAFDAEDTARLHELGIKGSALARLDIGDQTFYITDISESHVAASVYEPYNSSNNGEPQHILVDNSYPYMLVHDDRRHGFVTRVIRTNQKIILGRDADKVDIKSKRFRYQNDAHLSRQHASIELDPKKGFIITDLNSTNGTKLRYSTLTSNNHHPSERFSASNEEITSSLGRESSATNALMKLYEFFPRQKVEIDGREFLLSDIVKTSRYSYAIMYTSINEGNGPMVVPRFLYKSQSDGGWRVGYGIDKKGRFIKEADKKEWHYTQETKLDAEILEALDNSGVVADNGQDLEKHLLSIFSTQNAFSDESDSRHEISYYHNQDIDKTIAPMRYLSAGFLDENTKQSLVDAGYRSIGDYLNRLDTAFDKLPGFIPNFKQPPLSIEKRDHTLLGQVNIEHYAAHLGQEPIVWSIASDQKGRVWIDNIRLVNNKISSYGTPSRVFDAGVLTSKPLEYAKQSSGLSDSERISFNQKYYDITPVLDNLLPVRAYRNARDIFRVSN